jgi:hypothetical protein
MCYDSKVFKKIYIYIPLPAPISDEDVVSVDDITLRGSWKIFIVTPRLFEKKHNYLSQLIPSKNWVFW